MWSYTCIVVHWAFFCNTPCVSLVPLSSSLAFSHSLYLSHPPPLSLPLSFPPLSLFLPFFPSRFPLTPASCHFCNHPELHSIQIELAHTIMLTSTTEMLAHSSKSASSVGCSSIAIPARYVSTKDARIVFLSARTQYCSYPWAMGGANGDAWMHDCETFDASSFEVPIVNCLARSGVADACGGVDDVRSGNWHGKRETKGAAEWKVS